MLINEANGRIINSNDVYIHDDHLTSVCFDRVTRNLTLIFQILGPANVQYSMQFVDVKSFQMTSCDFWGIDDTRVLEWVYVEPDKRVLTMNLIKKWGNTTLLGKKIPSYDNFLESEMLLASGDSLQILCKEILYNKP